MRSSDGLARIVWVPGQPIPGPPLDRALMSTKRPAEPMGEAWFMGKTRKRYTDLLGDLDHLETDYLQHALEEIAAGTTSFGYRDEWTEWFHYLAPRLVGRSSDNHVDYLYEYLVTAFMALHPGETVIGDREHVLALDIFTCLALAPTDASRWRDGAPDFERTMYNVQYWRTGHNPWTRVSGDIAAGACLCFKYLDVDQLGPWIDSALKIDEPHFRTQFLLWLVEAEPLISGRIRHLSEIRTDACPSAGPSWTWSHLLSGATDGANAGSRMLDYVDARSLDAKRAVVAKALGRVDLEKHQADIDPYPYLLEAAEPVFDQLPGLYA